MRSVIQEELFGAEQYTCLCSVCRGEFPRSLEFFPQGRCHDKLASFCRKCANVRAQVLQSVKESEELLSQLNLLDKKCEECGSTKELREFYMSSHSPDGKTSCCKNCIDAKSVERQMRQQRLGDLAWAVYFIQDSRNNKVKIGTCDDPFLTLTNLQKGSSETLHLLVSHEAGQKDAAENIESTLHSLFQTHHTGNGWFEMVPSLEQYISLLEQGDFEKAEILLKPKMNSQDTVTEKNLRKDSTKETIVVEGQKFPSLAAAANATGYTAEQLKKHLQTSEEVDTTPTSNRQKIG
ncbi:MAG: hypothetical protein H8E38_07385 [SAR324 cluster bacterium]|nr:hypothetical protein [SAR324 cluster bacterium]MBL7034482.1 hypothetical protein [SAR324 cluster bacterium]